FKALGHLQRIIVVFGFPLVVALAKANAFASNQINSWDYLHEFKVEER
ncbi:MAG: hypothetical protein RLZZ207_507, partial [Bacteroidota bacterium]